MKKVVAEIQTLLAPESLASQIAWLWTKHTNERRAWVDQQRELRDYIFATDTTTTSNSGLPWKNKTTTPKLCQIRDNLHANYEAALFPNDNWLKWEAHSKDSATKDKRDAIEAYMKNKLRESNFTTTVSQALYDYIDCGNAFYDVEWVNESTVDSETGEIIPGYIGPKLCRLSYLDIVFNPIASSFDDTYKITRYVKTLGEMEQELEDKPELGYNREVIEHARDLRKTLSGYGPEDWDKQHAYQVDGFGTLYEYYASGYVEILEFEGSIHDQYNGEFLKNVIITVIDRTHVVRKEKMPSWLGKSTKGHVGWRFRPDNLYAMGPLNNLVGMQYRIDHLENLKADAMDLSIMPPLVISGSVEVPAEGWAPNATWYLGEGGAVNELGKNLNGVIAADNQIALLEIKMEEMAGAPKQAMGIRTPGEKTAFEVQTLDQAASRIFQHKIRHFEINFLEPALNRMLEVSRRNMDGTDVVRVMDNDLGAVNFLSITKEDITAAGKLRPVGARHFAAQATMVQNLAQFSSTPLWEDIKPHISKKALAKMFEEILNVEEFELYGDNIGVMEDIETAQFVSQGQEDIAVADATPTEAPEGMVPQ